MATGKRLGGGGEAGGRKRKEIMNEINICASYPSYYREADMKDDRQWKYK